jgi:hypothetical protein
MLMLLLRMRCVQRQTRLRGECVMQQATPQP